MLKCKYNEDCSLYPACGHTCGVPVEELLRIKSQRIRDMEHVVNDLAGYQVLLMEQALYKVKDLIKKPNYIPSCPYGYRDCISDPAYIRCYHPEWWEELGMPTECECADEYEEGCHCRYYDDEDK
jgi:hypothetical protein